MRFSNNMRTRRNRPIMPTMGQKRRADPMLIVVIAVLTILIVGALATLNWLGNQPRFPPAAASPGSNALLPLANLPVILDFSPQDILGPAARMVWLETHDSDIPVVDLRLGAVARL